MASSSFTLPASTEVAAEAAAEAATGADGAAAAAAAAAATDVTAAAGAEVSASGPCTAGAANTRAIHQEELLMLSVSQAGMTAYAVSVYASQLPTATKQCKTVSGMVMLTTHDEPLSTLIKAGTCPWTVAQEGW